MITIKEPFGYSFGVVKYDPRLDKTIKNWEKTCIIKQFNGWVYINSTAISYFCELLRKENVSYALLTEIDKNGMTFETAYEDRVITRNHIYSLSHQTKK